MIEQLAAIVGSRWVLTDNAQTAAYACDALMAERVSPRAVVLPASTAEVAAAVRACQAAGVCFVARGAGTGLSGGALPHPQGIVISLTRLNAIKQVDIANERVVVEPGVTNLAVSEAVAQHGYYYAPDPSSQQVCTVGGNVAENSGGAHCLKHGFTLNHVLSVEFVTAQGDVCRLGHAVPDGPGLDLLGVIVGSEGTLGIVTEVTLRVMRRPQAVVTLLAAFASTDAAGEAVTRIIGAGILPAAIEMMDRLSRDAAETAVHAGYPDADAILLVEVDGVSEDVTDQATRIEETCLACAASETRRASTTAERARMWRGRRAAFAAMGRVSPDYYVQDGVVPRTQLAPVLAGIADLASEAGLRVANVFHAGDGNLHPLVLFDAAEPDQAHKARDLADRILALCLDAGGSITGEHGVGHDKACAMPSMFSGADLTVMDRLRAAFDRERLCNPEKLLPTPRLCGEVPGFYRQHPLEREGVAERF